LQEGIESAIPIPVEQRFGFQGALVPPAQHLALAQLGDFQVIRVDIDVADDLDLGDVLQNLSGDLEQGAREVAGDTLVAPRPLEMLQQKAGIETMGAGREAPDAHVIPLASTVSRLYGKIEEPLNQIAAPECRR